MHASFTPEEYLDFIENPNSKVTSIEVKGTLMIPPKLKRFPNLPTKFSGALLGQSAKMPNINVTHITWAQLLYPELKRLTVKTARTIILSESGVTYVEGDIQELRLWGCHALRAFGPETKLDDVGLEPNQLPLLLRLKKPPYLINTTATDQPRPEFQILSDVLGAIPEGKRFFSGPAAQQLLRYVELVIEAPSQLIAHYPAYTELPEFFHKHLKGSAKKADKPIARLKQDIQTKLTELAKQRLRQAFKPINGVGLKPQP